MILKIMGLWLTLDGISSIILVYDKKLAWQVARIIRTLIGIALLLY